jgi:putative flippase GtrA
MLKKLLDRSLLLFLLIGAGNTLLTALIMTLLFPPVEARFGSGTAYWAVSAFAFALTSVLSFILNMRLSFQYRGRVWAAAVRFALVIAVCYLIAYSVAQPVTGWILARFLPADPSLTAKIALYTGQIIFTLLNYAGQRFFAFRKEGEAEETPGRSPGPPPEGLRSFGFPRKG